MIAARYGGSVDALRRANQLRGNIIRAGDALLVREQVQRKTLRPQRRSTEKRTAPTAGPGTRFEVTVRPGDSLWTRPNTAPAWLADGMACGNGMCCARADPLWSIGKVLPPRPSTRCPRNEPRCPGGWPIAFARDSRARIAKRYRVTVADIVGWNALDPKAYLQPGRPLTLFIAVTAVN